MITDDERIGCLGDYHLLISRLRHCWILVLAISVYRVGSIQLNKQARDIVNWFGLNIYYVQHNRLIWTALYFYLVYPILNILLDVVHFFQSLIINFFHIYFWIYHFWKQQHKSFCRQIKKERFVSWIIDYAFLLLISSKNCLPYVQWGARNAISVMQTHVCVVLPCNSDKSRPFVV